MPMYSAWDTPKGWVSPFGNPRIKAYSRLPEAYRRVSRPSSPLDAKASTRCPSHTSSTVRRDKPGRTALSYKDAFPTDIPKDERHVGLIFIDPPTICAGDGTAGRPLHNDLFTMSKSERKTEAETASGQLSG